MLAAGIVYWMMPDDGKLKVRVKIVLVNPDQDGNLDPYDDKSLSTPQKTATIHFLAENNETGEYEAREGTIDLSTDQEGTCVTRLPPGRYKVIALVPGIGFHEVFRTVPSSSNQLSGRYRHNRWKKLNDYTVELPIIAIANTDSRLADMVFIKGADSIEIGSPDLPDAPVHTRRIPDFYIDTHETTKAEWNQYLKAIHRKPVPDDQEPISSISPDLAFEFAEWRFCRLPTEFEFELAARRELEITEAIASPSPRQMKDRSAFVSAKQDNNNLSSLTSGLAEITSSRFLPYPSQRIDGLSESFHKSNLFVVRGYSQKKTMAQDTKPFTSTDLSARRSLESFFEHAGIGFRCARSAHPSLSRSNSGKHN